MGNTKTYYMGYPHVSDVPHRIGNGYRASNLMEARSLGVDELRANGQEFGLLCILHKKSVEVVGTVRADGTYSRVIVNNGILAMNGPDMEGWNWKPVLTPKH